VAMVQRLLQRAGHRVLCFQDPRTALRELQADPQAADLVITDFNMPGCSGLDVARELAALRPELPVIVSSGYISDSVAELARQAGVRALMHKERTIEELEALVRQLLAEPPPA
jgi:CheY-like chemotaxis protein